MAMSKLPFPEIPRQRGPTDFVPIATLLPRVSATACHALKPISGRRPLRCTRPAGHDGDHGMADRAGIVFVRWSR